MKIGIIIEEKASPDIRVTLRPTHCKTFIENGLGVVVKPSKVRCFLTKITKLRAFRCHTLQHQFNT